MTGRHLRRAHRRPDVYLHPAAHRDLGDLPHQLRRDLHVVVVPLTGNRRIDVAVLLDTGSVELLRVRRVLPDATLFVVTTGPATPELVAAAQIAGATVLPRASAEQVRKAVLDSIGSAGHRIAA